MKPEILKKRQDEMKRRVVNTCIDRYLNRKGNKRKTKKKYYISDKPIRKKNANERFNSKGVFKLLLAIGIFSTNKKQNVCKGCSRLTYGEYNASYCESCDPLYHITNEYGIGVKEYLTILKDQRNRCAICNYELCKNARRGSLDHCHALDHVRGILCTNCNLGLGQFKDDGQIIKKASAYLEKAPILDITYPKQQNRKLVKQVLLHLQGDCCAICETLDVDVGKGKWQLDHDHYSRNVRGVLCSRCNKGLGHFKDNVYIMRYAIKYLSRNEITRSWWFQREVK
jgi:Recombination endonuclease VII